MRSKSWSWSWGTETEIDEVSEIIHHGRHDMMFSSVSVSFVSLSANNFTNQSHLLSKTEVKCLLLRLVYDNVV